MSQERGESRSTEVRKERGESRSTEVRKERGEASEREEAHRFEGSIF